MTDRIKRLKIAGFRGATRPLDLEFDANKPVVLIFGENGTGKSTIVDAIEAAGAGSTAFLDDWKLGKGKRKESYIPALGKKPGDVSIGLEFGSNTYNATLNAKGLQLCNTADRPVIKVLRRKSLQAFMDADPAQRYKEVATFLDIPQIESSETSLREALKEAKKQFESATSSYSLAAENLQGLWEAEGSPGMDQKLDAQTWARQQASTPTDQLQAQLDNTKAGVRYSETLIAQTAAVEATRQQLEQAQQTLQQAEEALAALETGEAQSSSELVTLLHDAKIYLDKTPDTLCPVCEETTIVPGQLAQRLQQRIDSMSALKQASDAKQEAQQAVKSRQDELNKAGEKLLNVAQAAQQHFYPEVAEDNAIEHLRGNNRKQALAQASALNDKLASGLEKLQASLDGTQKQVNNLASIRQYVKSLDEKSAEAKQKETLSKRLKKAVDIVEKKRKSYVEGILVEIAQAVDALYQKIHPAEGIGNIKLKLDEKQRGSMLYGVAFGGQEDVQPQPYYSESHLDTLGLCIFLALAKRGEASNTLVVLDDVLGSVDQQHLRKTIDMLMQEANTYAQLIITTHYRPLRNRFVSSRTGTAHVQVIDLKKWRFSDGVRHVTPKLEFDALQALLADEDSSRSQIAIEAGRFLENCFDHFTLLYGLRMARKPEPAYTLNELYCAVRGIKGWKMKAESGEVELKLLIDNLQPLMPVRNQVGAHYNENGDLLSDDEIVEFGQATLKLANLFICSSCSGMAEKLDKVNGFWACSCGQTQMLPI